MLDERLVPHFLPDAVLEPGPSFLSAVVLESPVDAVLHHHDELLVAQQPVPVLVEDLENCLNDVTSQLFPRADVDSSGKFILCYGFICQCVHPHCNLEVVKVVQKLTKVLEFLKADSLFFLQSQIQSV